MHQSPEIGPEPIQKGADAAPARINLKAFGTMILALLSGCAEKSLDVAAKPQAAVASPLSEPKVPNVQVVGGPAILPFVPSPHDSLPADNGENNPNRETGAWQPRD